MVSFVYFDVGGTLMRDFSQTNLWQDLKSELGVPADYSAAFDSYYDELEPQMCIGSLTTERVLDLLSRRFDLTPPDHYSLLHDGFMSRFQSNPSMQSVVDYALGRFGCGLLTNMYPGMLDLIKSQSLLPRAVWQTEIDSCVVKLRKPEPDIYKLAEKAAGVVGKQILFVDNTQKNLDIPVRLGWQTFHYNPAVPEISSSALLAALEKC